MKQCPVCKSEVPNGIGVCGFCNSVIGSGPEQSASLSEHLRYRDTYHKDPFNIIPGQTTLKRDEGWRKYIITAVLVFFGLLIIFFLLNLIF